MLDLLLFTLLSEWVNQWTFTLLSEWVNWWMFTLLSEEIWQLWHPTSDTMIWYAVMWWLLFNRLSYRQDKRMDELNLFIDYHTKCIVSIIWARHVLTLHLSHANWCKPNFPYTGSCKNALCMLYNFSQIESYQTFLSCNPLLMDDEETLILLYH